jgi:hypothetical protein
MMTLPLKIEEAPVIVILNAGLLHRAEPYRLNVLACRRMAEIGYISLRVDIAGKGDTPARNGLKNRESVALDWLYIKEALLQKFGERDIIIMGICSGADNGIKIAAQDKAVKGLILIDAISKQDSGFSKRAFIKKISNGYTWISLPKILFRKLFKQGKLNNSYFGDVISLRDEPNDEDKRMCFNNLVLFNGRILAIFTSHATAYYNQKGQFCRSLGITGLEQICDEIFWPNVQHIFPVQVHRDRLLAAISNWCEVHLNRFRSKELI